MPHLLITSNTTNVMIAIIVAPAAIGRTDEPALKTK